MSDEDPPRRTPDDRILASRAELAALTGLSVSHLKTLWTARAENQHPEPVEHIGRTPYFDQEQWRDWFDQLTRQRQTRLTTATPGGDPYQLLTMAQAAHRLGYANGDIIRGYRNQRPGYFPEPDAHTRMPSGRYRPLWFATTVDEFERGRGHRRPTGRPPAAGQST